MQEEIGMGRPGVSARGDDSSGLGTWPIVGIVAACVLLVLVLGLLACLIMRCRPRHHDPAGESKHVRG